MIRPVTLICWILALSAGLYLYRAKHEVELIDQHIDLIAKQTADLRVESRALLDEWIRLGEPEQLHKYSDEYLGLQPISPGQFSRLSDLAARLPAQQADPPDGQANVVAQSSGGTSLGASSPDDQSAGNQAGVVLVQPAAADPDQETAASADDIPVPPIPPPMSPVSATSASAAPALPLQARPVTPRPADGQIEPETTRTRVAASPQGVDDPHTGVTRLVTSATAAEPHPASQGPASGQAPGQPGGQSHGLPPLQTQAPRDVSGLPPLQTQGPTREVAQGPARGPGQGQSPGRAPGQAPNQPALRPVESRTADNRLNEPPREIRPTEAPPLQRQATEPRVPGAEYGRQGPAPTEQAQTGQASMAPAQGGSLLGMSRGSAPLPLPAPMPVNANWSGPPGSGR
jgi:hypothetical protein